MARAVLKLKRPINEFDIDIDENSLEANGYKKIEYGEWISTPTAWIYCSKCGFEPHNETNYKSNFCPNCGAIMDGEA